MSRDEARQIQGEPMRSMLSRALALVVVFAVTSCGESPLESIGLRSSGWINEPTVPTTVAVETTTQREVPAERLLWANDTIETENLDDHDALLEEVFSRREGDRFIQASRREIAVALPGIAFPSVAPSGAEWVSSQLVFDNDGSIAADPSAAFGIWSAEPYTRSRSVAQMVVIRVATDPVGAEEAASAEPSCERFEDSSSERCEVRTVGDRATWRLSASSGSTFVWFEDDYRYEVYGRSFVPVSILEDMTASMVSLASLTEESS
jgi:hypothetical protein